MTAPPSRRHDAPLELPQLRLAPALRRVLRRGYGRRELGRDLLAGTVVGLVALPLAMALAIATGVPPQHGIYTAIIAGATTALLGGSPMQVSGPTAAFVVVLTPIVSRFGIGGLLMASLMAGLMLVGMGIARLGRLVEFIPYPVTAGFTAGIAVVIATLQLKDLLGLQVSFTSHHFLDRARVLIYAVPTTRWPELAIGALTLVVLLVFPFVTRRVPAPLVALALAAVVAWGLSVLLPGFEIATIGSRFTHELDGVSVPGIPRQPPIPLLPWAMPGPDGQPLHVGMPLLRELLPSAFTIAMLGAIESLLSAVVADGMAGTRHDSNAELVAQGIGNVLAPFFGGFAATGAIARTATNVRAGAVSPVSAVVHAFFVLAAVLVLAPALAMLPMAALAALLLVVAYNMSEVGHFIRVVRIAPKSDTAVQIGCFLLTVAFDMVVAVTAGVVLAALLFMRRMAEISRAKLATGGKHPALRDALPEGVALYEIAGPLFFGAAQKAMSALDAVSSVRAVIFDLRAVPVMDVTGLVNLESALTRLRKTGAMVALVGVQEQPLEVLERAGMVPDGDTLVFCDDLQEAVDRTSDYAPPPPSSSIAAAFSRRPPPVSFTRRPPPVSHSRRP